MRIVSTATTFSVAIVLGGLTACTAIDEAASPGSPTPAVTSSTSPSTSRVPDSPATDMRTNDAAYDTAVATYPRELPPGYSFPSGLIGAASADKWWWCSQIDAAWEAYFDRNDEAAALGYLRAAADVDPGSYGQFDQPADSLPLNRKIDREVRYINDGVDSQYVEYTAQGCWDWAKSVGSEFPGSSQLRV